MTDENKTCFLTGKSDCDLVDITVNGLVYLISEEIADEYSLKKIKSMIEEKVKKETEESKKKKEEAMSKLTEAVSELGISKEELANLLLGQSQKTETKPSEEPSKPVKQTKPKDDDFVEVDGELKSKTLPVKAESGIGSTLPAYDSVKNEGKKVVESDKRVKKLDDGGVVEKSNMGTTVIRIMQQDPNLEKTLSQVDDEGNLIRAAVSGSGRASGSRTVDCSLCAGSGIARIGHKTCQKCGGAGIVYV